MDPNADECSPHVGEPELGFSRLDAHCAAQVVLSTAPESTVVQLYTERISYNFKCMSLRILMYHYFKVCLLHSRLSSQRLKSPGSLVSRI